MTLPVLAMATLAILAVGYLTYGRFIARQYRLNDGNPTPAVLRNDGVDFVPARPFYLLAQHFSAIAAAGPIAGPILACMAFGWGPCLLWIILGVIFIGAVHDFSALVASIRHGAHSIAEMARIHLGRRAWLVLVGFIYLALLYVIIAFTDVTARTFMGAVEELAGRETPFNKGGAVAAASTMYLVLALVMGLVQRLLRPPIWLVTLIFVPATLGVVYAGTLVDTILVFDLRTWYIAICAYCFVASLLPLWLLQQPRGYLGGFVLYMALAVGVIGLLLGDFDIKQPMFKEGGGLASWSAWLAPAEGGTVPALTSLLFPFLFVTIACGACSGFHGLVCGGTTSKQIAKESHCKPVAFGAMLMEGFVAVIALATIMMLAPSQAQGRAPGTIYGDGMAQFMAVILGPGAMVFAVTFGAMAFSTFVFDTLDVSCRLGRYLLSELMGGEGSVADVRGGGLGRWLLRRALPGAITAGLPLLILLTSDPRGYGGGTVFWTLFGTSNQMLAALTLLGVTVWLYRTRRRYWYTLLPTLFVAAVTTTALVAQIVAGARVAMAGGTLLVPVVINAAIGLILGVLAAIFVAEAVAAVLRERRGRGGDPVPPAAA